MFFERQLKNEFGMFGFLLLRYDTYFYKVFKVYTQLWKFQQVNWPKLVETGLKRWEIGERSSWIAQLYYGQYMRTSESSYLSETYIFYEVILTREHFKEGSCQDHNLANKQLRFLARFLMVCLVLNRREIVHQLVNQLKTLVDECKRTFQVFLFSFYFLLHARWGLWLYHACIILHGCIFTTNGIYVCLKTRLQ